MGHWLHERRPDSTLVIVADDGGAAERIYRRLGFSLASRQWTLRGERSEVLARRARR